MIIWELRLFDNTGARVATFVDWPELRVERRVNGMDTWALRLDGDDPRVALFEEGGLLEGWWCSPEDGLAWRREFCGFVVDDEQSQDDNGAQHYLVSGLGIEAWLSWTLVDAAAGSAESRKSGAGETALKAFVDEQAGPGAGSRARDTLTVEADAALGNTWSGQRTNKNLLDVCVEIAEATGIQFGIERTGDYTFELRCWEPEDRRDLVIFAEERENMGQPKLARRRSQSVTRVKVAGQGEGADRAVVYVEDATALAASPIGRREFFRDARDQDDTDAYTARGQQVIDENRATETLSFRVLQSPGCLYGFHYHLGDWVTARYGGRSYDRLVDRVTWLVTANETTVDAQTIALAEEGS